jgi:pilus assembly protein CpaB
VGIAAVVFGRGWLNNEAEASRPAVTTAIEPVAEVALTQIYVANANISRGDQVTIESLRLAEWPTDYVPLGAITDPASFINPDGSFPFSLGTIVSGEPVLLNKLSSQTVRDTLAQLIEPGYRAVSVEVDDATGVAGFILPDHRVDVHSFRELSSDFSRDKIQKGELLLSNIRVLAIDQSFEEGQDGARLAQTVTLQVTPEQANLVGVAVQAGTIGLALRRADDETKITAAAPRPVRAAAPGPAAAPAKPAFANIRVIAGEEEETVSAPVSSSTPQSGN